MKPFARALAFFLLTVGLYLVALTASSRLQCGEFTLLQGLTHDYLEPGGQYQTLRRFREAETRGHVDVVVLGASHTYRGFDPRLFEARGYRAMNLGSTNQTPLNSYAVAERYVPKLSPRLVILEVGWATLSNDGLEATRDLTVNTPWSWSIEEMAIATANLGAISFATAKGLGLAGDESKAEQRAIEGETYVAGGYCESSGERSELLSEGEIVFHMRSRQLDWLARTSALVARFGAKVVWVSFPLPRDYLARVADRARLTRTIAEQAKARGVDYWDFSEGLDLDPRADFKDILHLNARGVRTFDGAFLDRLDASGYLR